ncbi:MAG: hypothetical protein WEA75_07520 [Acidimicrobiia bacterium]
MPSATNLAPDETHELVEHLSHVITPRRSVERAAQSARPMDSWQIQLEAAPKHNAELIHRRPRVDVELALKAPDGVPRFSEMHLHLADRALSAGNDLPSINYRGRTGLAHALAHRAQNSDESGKGTIRGVDSIHDVVERRGCD